MVEKNKKIIKILCPKCGVHTNHQIVWGFKGTKNGDLEADIWDKTEVSGSIAR